jgi:hypothetical protein
LKVAQGRLESLEGRHGRKAAFEAVVRLLRCTVAEAMLFPAPARKDDALAALICGLQGKPMTPGSLRVFVEKAATLIPEGVVGFRMTADRGSDLSGIRVVVETVTETVSRGRSVGKWTMSEIVMLGQEGLLNDGGNARGN